MDYFIIDTNVLLVAVYNEHTNHPARASARMWLKTFYSNPQARIMIDCIHSEPQFVNENNSMVLREYSYNINRRNPDHLMHYEFLTTSLKMYKRLCRVIEFDSLGNASLDSELASLVDPSDRKFVALAMQHREYEPSFRPPYIVYAEDLLDWAACRPYLEEKGVIFVNLNDGGPNDYRRDLKFQG